MKRHDIGLFRDAMRIVWPRRLLDARYGPGIQVGILDLGGGTWAAVAMKWTGNYVHAPTIGIHTDHIDEPTLVVTLDVAIDSLCRMLARVRLSTSQALVDGHTAILAGRATDEPWDPWEDFEATQPPSVMPCPDCGARPAWQWLAGVDAFKCPMCGYVVHGIEAAHWRRRQAASPNEKE